MAQLYNTLFTDFGFGKLRCKILMVIVVCNLSCTKGQQFTKATNNRAMTKLQGVPIYFPLEKKGFKRISSRFGMRRHPTLNKNRFHAGLDLAAAQGTPVYASANGEVISANYSKTYGNYVILRHGSKFKTLYGHMSKRAVVKSQKVRQGQIIGYVGSTGRSTGPHLHYEIIKGNKTIDPFSFWMKILQKQTLVTL